MESTAVSPASVPTHARGTTTRNRSSIGLPERVGQYHTQSHLTAGRAARPRPRRRRRRLHQPPHLPQRLLPHFYAAEAAPQAPSTSTPPPPTPLPTRPLSNPSRPPYLSRKMRPTRRPPPSSRLLCRPMLTTPPPSLRPPLQQTPICCPLPSHPPPPLPMTLRQSQRWKHSTFPPFPHHPSIRLRSHSHLPRNHPHRLRSHSHHLR